MISLECYLNLQITLLASKDKRDSWDWTIKEVKSQVDKFLDLHKVQVEGVISL